MSKLLKCYQHLKTQFLAYWLALLIGEPRFCLMVVLVCLTIRLAIGRVKSIGKEVSIGFSRYSLKKELISFFRC